MITEPLRQLHHLWSGEYDDIEIAYEISDYVVGGVWWTVTLVSPVDRGLADHIGFAPGTHQANWVTYRWAFTTNTLDTAIAAARDFAQALAAFAPPEDD